MHLDDAVVVVLRPHHDAERVHGIGLLQGSALPIGGDGGTEPGVFGPDAGEPETEFANGFALSFFRHVVEPVELRWEAKGDEAGGELGIGDLDRVGGGGVGFDHRGWAEGWAEGLPPRPHPLSAGIGAIRSA